MSIKRLADIYSSIVSSDHHKHKDGLFYIEVKYNGWDDTLTYTAAHYGYMNEFEIHSATFEEAEKALKDNIIEIISKEIESQRRVLAAPDDFDYYTRTAEELDAYEKEVLSISAPH